MGDNPIVTYFMELGHYLSPLWLGLYRQNACVTYELFEPRLGYSFSIRWLDYLQLYQISHVDLRTNERSHNFFPQEHVDQQYLTYLHIRSAQAQLQNSNI